MYAIDVQRDVAYKIIVGCEFNANINTNFEVNLAATTANKFFIHISVNFPITLNVLNRYFVTRGEKACFFARRELARGFFFTRGLRPEGKKKSRGTVPRAKITRLFTRVCELHFFLL